MKNDPSAPTTQGFAGWQANDKLDGPGPAQPSNDAPSGQPRQPTVVRVRPMAQPAGMRKRHWKLLASFGFLVVLPLVAVIFYMITFANDQYSSITGFTVRQEEGGGASELLGGLTQAFGGGGGSDADILYEFVQSQEMVRAIDAQHDLRGHYSQHWPSDWVFSLSPDPTIEDLLSYWGRIVRISLDGSSGLIEVRVVAFEPEMARAVATGIVKESQDMINALSEQARNDAMSYAVNDLSIAEARLKESREALTRFRTRTQIVDPEADILGRMGVINNLQQRLADSLIELGELRENTNANDPRVIQALRRTDVIREGIASERNAFATGDTTNQGEDYPTLIAEFESLSVDREFAEETYRAALAALDLARNNALRQSRYLATYIDPTLAEDAEYPQRLGIIALAALFLVLAWSIMALIYYSLRDRS